MIVLCSVIMIIIGLLVLVRRSKLSLYSSHRFQSLSFSNDSEYEEEEEVTVSIQRANTVSSSSAVRKGNDEPETALTSIARAFSPHQITGPHHLVSPCEPKRVSFFLPEDRALACMSSDSRNFSRQNGDPTLETGTAPYQRSNPMSPAISTNTNVFLCGAQNILESCPYSNSTMSSIYRNPEPSALQEVESTASTTTTSSVAESSVALNPFDPCVSGTSSEEDALVHQWRGCGEI
jgi:hypothetical protein